MAAKNKGVLEASELRHVADHAVGNSHDLLNEAEILFERERWARAAALAVLSVEESGKAHLCHVWAFHLHPADDEAWADFWDDFADHPGKIDRWLSRVDQIGDCTDFGAWKHDASRAHLSKLWCLYVDFTVPDRHVVAPQFITREDAEQFMDLAREAAAYWSRTDWGGDPA